MNVEEMPPAAEVHRMLRNMGERGLLEQFPAVVVGKPKAWEREVDQSGIEIALPFERPLYQTPTAVAVESEIATGTEEVDADLLFTQNFIDQTRLVDILRTVLPENSSALLSDITAIHPIEQGAAEIVGYLALDDEDLTIEMDDTGETVLEYTDPADPDVTKRARLPKVTVRRR